MAWRGRWAAVLLGLCLFSIIADGLTWHVSCRLIGPMFVFYYNWWLDNDEKLQLIISSVSHWNKLSFGLADLLYMLIIGRPGWPTFYTNYSYDLVFQRSSKIAKAHSLPVVDVLIQLLFYWFYCWHFCMSCSFINLLTYCCDTTTDATGEQRETV